MSPKQSNHQNEATGTRPKGASRSGRGLAVEALENRSLMAGDMTAENYNGELRITGDGHHNGVVITLLATGSFSVKGVSRHGPTRVNGVTSAVTFSNVTWDIRVDLAGGDDFVQIRGPQQWQRVQYRLSEDSDIVIFSGEGNDVVDVRRINNAGFGLDSYMSIDTGSGNDKVTVSDVWSADGFWVHTGSGNDSVAFSRAFTVANTTMRVATGPDQDRVRVNRCTLGTLMIDLGSGVDVGSRFTNNQLAGTTIHEIYGWDFFEAGGAFWRNNTRNAAWRTSPFYFWTDLA